MNRKVALTLLATAAALIALFAASCGGSARFGGPGHNQGGGSASLTTNSLLS